MAYIFSSIYKG